MEFWHLDSLAAGEVYRCSTAKVVFLDCVDAKNIVSVLAGSKRRILNSQKYEEQLQNYDVAYLLTRWNARFIYVLLSRHGVATGRLQPVSVDKRHVCGGDHLASHTVPTVAAGGGRGLRCVCCRQETVAE